MSKLIDEFRVAKVNQSKTSRHDDGIDSLRYSLSRCNFDYSDVSDEELSKYSKEKKIKSGRLEDERPLLDILNRREKMNSAEEHFRYWNNLINN